MTTGNDAVGYVEREKLSLGVIWMNSDRVSDDWKVKIYQQVSTGKQFAIYAREAIILLLESPVAEGDGRRLLASPPTSHALDIKVSNFKGNAGFCYEILDLNSLAAVLSEYLWHPVVSAANEDDKSADSIQDELADQFDILTSGNGLSPEELLKRMEINSETGRVGELIAMAYERSRLAEQLCPDPQLHLRHTALSRVDAGFDIESNWSGERRCIEVKSSTTENSDFYMSEGERKKLLKLGAQAWLYRVYVRSDGSGEVVEVLQDPLSNIPTDAFQPVVWRISRPGI